MRTMNAYTYVATPFFPLQRHRFISRFNSFSFFFISFCICKRGKKCPRIRRKPNTLKFLSLRQELSLLRQKKKKVLFLHILLTTDSLILLRIVGQHLLSCKTIAKKKRKQPRHPTFRTLALGRLNHCEVSIGRTATMQKNGGKCVRVSRATCF